MTEPAVSKRHRYGTYTHAHPRLIRLGCMRKWREGRLAGTQAWLDRQGLSGGGAGFDDCSWMRRCPLWVAVACLDVGRRDIQP